MKIQIFPEDIVKRCLWDSYTYYVVGSEKEAEKILRENKEFELSERDAIIIGLLKVIETDNLIHRFNDYFMHFLNNRSMKDKDTFLIKKKSLEVNMNKFLDKFPDYWVPDVVYKKSLTELVDYIGDFKSKVDKIEIHKVSDNFGTYDFVNSNTTKKLISFNY